MLCAIILCMCFVCDGGCVFLSNFKNVLTVVLYVPAVSNEMLCHLRILAKLLYSPWFH